MKTLYKCLGKYQLFQRREEHSRINTELLHLRRHQGHTEHSTHHWSRVQGVLLLTEEMCTTCYVTNGMIAHISRGLLHQRSQWKNARKETIVTVAQYQSCVPMLKLHLHWLA